MQEAQKGFEYQTKSVKGSKVNLSRRSFLRVTLGLGVESLVVGCSQATVNGQLKPQGSEEKTPLPSFEEIKANYPECIVNNIRDYLSRLASGDVPPKPLQLQPGDRKDAIELLRGERKRFYREAASNILSQGKTEEAQAATFQVVVTHSADLNDEVVEGLGNNDPIKRELVHHFTCDVVTERTLKEFLPTKKPTTI